MISTGPVAPNQEARLLARNRPDRKPAMYQSWQQLLFLHWAIPAKELEGCLPPGLHLDTFEGQAWLGVVPFFMRKVRPRGLPTVPGISNFLELNVRTYVFDDSGVPGVWFHSLDASSRLACALGRWRFHLPYREATMSAKTTGEVDYTACRHGESESAYYRYRGIGNHRTAPHGSLEYFLLERYVLYACDQREGRLWRGRVHHEPYRYRDVELGTFSTAPLRWNGLPCSAAPPDHACAAQGVDVSVFSLRKVVRSPSHGR